MLLGFGLFLMVGVAYSAAFGSLGGVLLAIGVSTIFIVFAITTAPQIRVEEIEGEIFLRAGRAKINVEVIGSAHELSVGERLEVTRGTRNDTAFQMTKGNFPVVEFEILDLLDPHRNWCLSSRTPAKLIDAIHTAKGPEIS